MRVATIILCVTGWVWTAFAFVYLAVRLRKKDSKTEREQ